MNAIANTEKPEPVIKVLRVLILEDNPDDAEMIKHALEQARFTVETQCVDSKGAFLAHLTADLDIILSDHDLPGFDALQALRLLNGQDLDIPFIIVSGAIREELAVECMKQGAADYLLKDRLARLAPAVERALEQKHQRGEQRKAEAALRKSEAKYRTLFEESNDAIYITDCEGRFIESNKAALDLFGYTKEDLAQRSAEELYANVSDRARFQHVMERRGAVRDFEVELCTKDGRRRTCLITATARRRDNGTVLGYQGIVRDITEHRRLQKEVLDISSQERRRMGRDLHDGLGQLLTGISFRVAALEGDLRDQMSSLASDAAEIGGMVAQAITQTRALAQGLNPIDLESGGLVTALHTLTADIEKIFGLMCVLVSPGYIYVEDQEEATQLYRIAQEAINNALKHGQPSQVMVTLRQDGRGITLRIVNDGISIPEPNRRRPGLGLRIMAYRARMIHGSLDVREVPEGGTAVTCHVPHYSNRQVA